MDLICTRKARYEYRLAKTGEEFFGWSQHGYVLDPDAWRGVRVDILDAAQERGHRLHRLFALVLGARAGLCAPPMRPDNHLAGYFDAMVAWIDTNKVRPVLVETASINRRYHMAGRPDALVRYGDKQILALVDLKTGIERWIHPLQLQFYNRLEGYTKATRLYTLYLGKDGAPREKRAYRNPTDWAAILCANGILTRRAMG